MENRKIVEYFIPAGPLERLQKRYKRWCVKYAEKPDYVFLRVLFWCLINLGKNFISLFSPARYETVSAQKEGVVRFMVYLRGGVGDILMASTYLKELYKWADSDCSFTICADQNRNAVQSIFEGAPYVEKIYFHQDAYVHDDFDAILNINRFPLVVFTKKEMLKKKAPRLNSLLESYKTFQTDNVYYKLNPLTDTVSVMHSLLKGHTRRSQTDVGHILGMDDLTKSFLCLDEKASDILTRHHLKKKRYLTFQRGTNVNDQLEESIRSWPVPYFNELICLLKAQFPDLLMVRLGAASALGKLDGIDVDLCGQTSFDELKIVLKQSLLHIDGECGMVHMNHALNGRSAVFFAQTRLDFCGYPENINIKAEGACPLWCEWVSADWQERCIRGFEEPPCMKNLTPRLAFDAIKDYIAKMLNRSEYTLVKTDESPLSEGVRCFLGLCEDESLFTAAKSGESVFYFDKNLTRTRIHELKQRGVSADFGDICNIPMADESCGAVVCGAENVSEYVKDEIMRVLKPGGTVLFSGNGETFKKMVLPQDGG